MEDYQFVSVDINGQTAVVTLNRPAQLNALNVVLIEELCDCVKKLSNDDNLKITVLKGSGGAFSAGGDIKEMLRMDGEEQFSSVMDKIGEMIVSLHTMPQLTISAVEGAAAGLGLSLALASDYVIADKGAKLAMNFIGIGLVPDGGGHFFMEKRLGEGKAKRLIWEGKVIRAEEAAAIGLIDMETADLDGAVEETIGQWLKKPLLAMIKTKKIYAELNRERLLKVLELEKKGQWSMRHTNDHQEGIRAFVEKRKPDFTGR